MSRRVVVTGSRDETKTVDEMVWAALSLRDAEDPITEMAFGCATGVDAAAMAWALEHCLCERFKADWDAHRRSAGPIRNGRMLREFKPDVVLAFPGGIGTADCVKQARAMNIPVLDAMTGEVLA